MMGYYPKANVASPRPTTPWVQNFAFSDKWPRDYDAYTMKFDHQFSQNNQMFVRLNLGEGRLVFPHFFDGIASDGRNRVTRPHYGIAFSDTISVSARTTVDVRLGYARGIENNRPWSDGFDIAALGFPSSFVNMVQSKAFPLVRVTDFLNLAGSPYIQDPGDTWSLQP